VKLDQDDIEAAWLNARAAAETFSVNVAGVSSRR
jgi:hypothetical protein